MEAAYETDLAALRTLIGDDDHSEDFGDSGGRGDHAASRYFEVDGALFVQAQPDGNLGYGERLQQLCQSWRQF